MDICKDRLYCDDKNDLHRTSSQTAMAIIAKKLISVLAPILTYTMDELLEYAPKIIKDDVEDIFDVVKYELPTVQSSINTDVLLKAKEKFSEAIDVLKKDKVIKNTLELSLYTNSKDLLELNSVEIEDWFMVSGVTLSTQKDAIIKFEIDDAVFEVYKSTDEKCPRCWKFNSVSEESLCVRCDDVMNKQ